MHREGMEREVVRRLTGSASRRTGREYVVRVYDDSEVIGPNGLHQVLVTEVTGPTIDFLMESCYDLATGSIFELPPGLMRRLARQLILVLKFLASEDVIHGGDGLSPTLRTRRVGGGKKQGQEAKEKKSEGIKRRR